MAFDVITPVQLGQAELAVTLNTLRTTPSGTRDFVKNIDIANTNGSSATVTLHLVSDGDVAGTDNTLLPTITIPANTIYQWAGVQILNGGDTIQAKASKTGVCVTISGGNAE